MAAQFLDEGVYRGKVVEWGLGRSSRGTDYFELVVRVEAVEAEDQAGKNYLPLEPPVRKSVQLYLSPKAVDSTAAALRNLGYIRKDLGGLDPSAPGAHDFAGEVCIKVEHGEYEGRPQEKVNLVRRPRRLKAHEVAAGLAVADAFTRAQSKALDAVPEGETNEELPF
jgi:hypothetical protein